MVIRRPLMFVLAAATFSQAALSHHSRAEFTGEVIELTGELIDIRWLNPHPSFRIRLDDAANTVWEIQAYGSVNTLRQTGVEEDLFITGQQVTFAGMASNRRELFLGTSALLPGGTEAILQYNGQPHWTGDRVGGSGSVVISQAELERAAVENRGFFRTWHPESTEIAVAHLIQVNRSAKYTEVSRAARADWDLTNNPITRCEPSWMPLTMMQPTAMELIDKGDTLMLNNDYLASVRTIHMGARLNTAEQPPSRMGFSRGRREGNTLVVETDRIAGLAFNSFGALQSEQMSVVETFTLSDDQSRLDYRMVMTDPVALDEPAVYETYYLALDRELEPDDGGNCD